jgi:hypothetical protein
MMCYAWRPNPSYSTSPPCPSAEPPAGSGPQENGGFLGLSWLTWAVIAGGVILLAGTGRR